MIKFQATSMNINMNCVMLRNLYSKDKVLEMEMELKGNGGNDPEAENE